MSEKMIANSPTNTVNVMGNFETIVGRAATLMPCSGCRPRGQDNIAVAGS